MMSTSSGDNLSQANMPQSYWGGQGYNRQLSDTGILRVCPAQQVLTLEYWECAQPSRWRAPVCYNRQLSDTGLLRMCPAGGAHLSEEGTEGGRWRPDLHAVVQRPPLGLLGHPQDQSLIIHLRGHRLWLQTYIVFHKFPAFDWRRRETRARW